MAARGFTWGEEEVKVLLAIWGDEKLQKELDGPKRKPLLHEKNANKTSRTLIQQRCGAMQDKNIIINLNLRTDQLNITVTRVVMTRRQSVL